MNITQYMPLAIRTEKPLPPNQRLLHGCMGLITECGEVVTELKRMEIYEKPLDQERKDHICEELGDMMWYMAILWDVLGVDHQCFDSLQKPLIHDSSKNLWALSALLFGAVIGPICHTVADIQAGVYKSENEHYKPMNDIGRCLSALFHGIEQVAHRCGSTTEQIMDANIEKLRLRFPDAYSNEAAEARADKAGLDARNS